MSADNTTSVCIHCGSRDVYRPVLVNINTGEMLDNSGDPYCAQCRAETSVIEQPQQDEATP